MRYANSYAVFVSYTLIYINLRNLNYLSKTTNLMKIILITLFFSLLTPFISCAQKVTIPDTPQNLWACVKSQVVDANTNEPLQCSFKLIETDSSSIVCQGKSDYIRWSSDDGVHEMEQIVLIIPDFRKKYRLEVECKNYDTVEVDLDYSGTFSLTTPLKERELRIEPILLTNKKRTNDVKN